MDIVRTLKHAAIELHHAIVKHLNSDTPQVITNQLLEASHHLASTIVILDRSDE